MFKMGLIKEASSDFEMLIHPGLKEPWVYFNFATCLIQLGQPMEPAPPNYHLNEKNALRKKLKNATRQLVQKSFEQVLGEVSFLQVEALGHTGTMNYVKAIEMCNEAMKYAGNDKELVLDSLSLKGICLYRLGHLLEAMRILHLARR